MKLFSLTAAVCLLAATAHANHCQQYTEQNDIDECYMKIALDYALLHNPRFPFGALVVDHTQNEISCFGANSNRKNKLLHGETAAFWNCTELYPSPTNDDMSDPGLDWSHQTLYTTGEPCPMCAAQSIYRGVARVVWGTSIPDINRSGRQQLMIRMDDVIASARLGGNRPDHRVPVTQGGVLKDECDHAFWCSFSNFRDQEYHQSMIEEDQQVFIAKRDNDYHLLWEIPQYNCQNCKLLVEPIAMVPATPCKITL